MKILNSKKLSIFISAQAHSKALALDLLLDSERKTEAEIKIDQLIHIATTEARELIENQKRLSAQRDAEFMDQFSMPDFKRPQREWTGTVNIKRVKHCRDCLEEIDPNDRSVHRCTIDEILDPPCPTLVQKD